MQVVMVDKKEYVCVWRRKRHSAERCFILNNNNNKRMAATINKFDIHTHILPADIPDFKQVSKAKALWQILS